MGKATGFGAIRRALGSRNFRIFSAGTLVSHLGTWAQRTAVMWVAWELTESGAWLGIVAFADLFPTVVLAPLTGAVADRVHRLRMMIVTQSLNLLQAAVLAGLMIGGLLTIEWLVALVAFGGAVVSFNQPVRFAIVPSLVPRQDLSTAISINSMIFNAARLVGPAVSGFLIAIHGAGIAFAFNSFTFLVFLVVLSMLRLEEVRSTKPRTPIGNIPAEIAEGYAYAARHPGIGSMLVLLSVVSVCGRPYFDLLSGFAGQVFERGAEGLGLLTSAVGLGAMLGALWLAQRGAIAGLTSVTVSCALLLSAALIAFTATDVFWLALVCLVVVGFAMIVVGVGEQTLIQAAVDPAMRGRVMGLYGMIGRGAPALGALVMGGLSTVVGFRWPVAGGAVLCLGAWLWAQRRKRMMAAALEVEHVT